MDLFTRGDMFKIIYEACENGLIAKATTKNTGARDVMELNADSKTTSALVDTDANGWMGSLTTKPATVL